VWAIGCSGMASPPAPNSWAVAFGWSEPLYRAWYHDRRYLGGRLAWAGHRAACSARHASATPSPLSLPGRAGSPRLTQAKYNYANSGIAPILYFGMHAAVLAAAIVVDTFRGGSAWPRLAAAAVVGAPSSRR